MPASGPLHVLLLEDSAVDAQLILDELRRGGYEPVARRVAGRAEMLEALREGSWQIVLLDYSAEGGASALETLAALGNFDVDLPAILISGALGEEEAADALRAGARDFVNRGHLARLVPAVARELQQVEARRERREGEEALRQSEQRLRLALRAGGMGSWEWDLASDLLRWSTELESMFGLEPGAFGGTYGEFIRLVHAEDRQLVGESVEDALAHDSPAVVYLAHWPDGTVRWHERKSQRVQVADGPSEMMAGVTFDVTEREEAAQSLRESEERFRLIAEHAHDLIALLDADGRYSYLSPSCESLLGYPTDALLGTVASELVHPDDWLDDRGWGEGSLLELRMRKADDTWLWVETLGYEINGRAERQFALIARDVSERKRAETDMMLLEDELRQSQKMEAIGSLAGGIAHDFNNILLVIRGYGEMLLKGLDEGHLRDSALQIDLAAERASEFTHQLLAFSRQQVLHPEVTDLNAVVEDTLKLLRGTIGADVKVELKLEPGIAPILIDRGQIAQAVLNLAINARDAMPNGGRLAIGTTTVEVDQDYAAMHEGLSAGPYTLMQVTDSGTGMDVEAKTRAFDPFFTTKAQGTGLGLATVYGLVKQSGGHISLDSELGVGTTFTLYFPSTSDQVTPAVEPPFVGSLEGTETVLLVEDADNVRALVASTLKSYGYTVLEAASGTQAVEISDRVGPVDLLLTDVVMPAMSGRDLADILLSKQPSLSVLFTSGYPSDTTLRQEIAESREAFIEKPYLPADLARKVRQVLRNG